MKTAWLIECRGEPTIYFVADGDWCSSANHAHQFATEIEAQTKIATMQVYPRPFIAAEHAWADRDD